VLTGPDLRPQPPRPFATGLRNSLGLAVTQDASLTTERLWQAENSVDYSDAKFPAEELNELERGARYGWPYCVSDAQGRSVVARGYEQRARCNGQRRPVQAWPAHVAPLQLLAVPPAVKGEAERPWSGRLLAVWHGHRAQGHRIVGWRIGRDGRPTGARENIVAGWLAMPGLRPQGNPAGITVDSQGRLWIVEDRNRTVLVVAPETPGGARP
jgi:glucose/arabinose dehydrogenase